MVTKTKDLNYLSRYRTRNTFNNQDSYQMRNLILLRSRDGFSNPKYRQQIKLGQSAGTAMSGRYDTLVERPFKGRVYWTNNGTDRYYSEVDGYICSSRTGNISTNPNVTLADNRAMSKFLKSIHQAKTEFQGQIFLGELRESLHMLRHPAESLRDGIKKYLQNVKQKKRTAPLHWQKTLGQTWLENAFGWQPLINDIDGAVKAYKRLTEVPHVKGVSGFGTDTTQDTGYPSILYGQGAGSDAPYLSLVVAQKVLKTALVKYRGAVWLEAKGPVWQRQDLFGFNAAEFLPTAWELLPWSFLVDYFSNIGDVLENSITSTAGLRWVNRSEVKETINSMAIRGDVGAMKALGAIFLGYQETSAGYLLSTSRSVERGQGMSVYVPPINLELPGTVKQFTNMLSLFASAQDIHPQRFRFK